VKKYGGLESSDIRRLKELEAKNRNPKREFAKLQLQEKTSIKT
jgi:hypothetical protein